MSGLVVVGIGVGLVGVCVRAARRAPVRDRLVAHRAPWRLPDRVRVPLARFLHDLPVTPERAVRTVAVAEVVTVVVALVLAPVLVGPAALATAAAGPVVVVVVRARVGRTFQAGLPGFVEQTAARLRAGHSVGTALADAATGPGPVAADVRRCLRRCDLGATLPAALAAWAAERRTADARAVAGALAVAVDSGAGAASALEGLASSLRDQIGGRADAAALSAQARLSAVVVGLAPVGFLVFSALVDPRSATRLVATDVGRVCLVVGLALDGLGGWWMHRIVRSAP